MDVELVIGWGTVKEPVQNQGDDTKDISHVVAPPPPRDRVLDEGPSNDGTKDGEGKRRHQDDGEYRPPPLIRHELPHDDVERQLAGSCYAVADVRRDEHLDGLRTRANDAADQSEDRGAEDHVLAAKDIREPTDEEEPDRGPHRVHGDHPDDVG